MKRACLMASAVAIGLALFAGPALADYTAGKTYYDTGRYNEAAREFSAAAEGGHALAQYMMGRLHQEGRGADRDLVRAYMWYSLSATNGYYPAVAARDSVGAALSSAQRAQAQQMASDWTLSHGRSTGMTSTQPSQTTSTVTYTGAPQVYAEPYSIRAVQRVLNELGYAAGPVDGVIGQKTRNAIRAFQIDAGLPVSGEPSRSLYESLLAAKADQQSPVIAQPQPVPQPVPQPQPSPQPTYDTQMIVDLQTELRKRGYDIPAITGKLDAATTVAIREYQADAGMVVDGRPSLTLLTNLRAPSTTAPSSIAYRDQVRQVQALLNARGYDAGPADGVMGPKTRDAIRTYQADAGLPVTGDVSSTLITNLKASSSVVTYPVQPTYPVGGASEFDQPLDPSLSGKDLIIAIEKELERLGYNVEENDDGILQRESRQALRQFQRDAGLTVSDEPTVAALAAMRSGRPIPGTALHDRYLKIEQYLAEKGYPVGIVDGYLDAQARAAIRQYQRDIGLQQTGVASINLLNHLSKSNVRASTTSNTVLEIERELQLRRYSVGPIDGVVDLRTQFGIESYQRQAGLPVTGEPTAALLAHMRANPQISAYGYGTSSVISGPYDLTQ